MNKNLIASVDRVMDAVSDLHDLRSRLVELDQLRAGIEASILERLQQIASAADRQPVLQDRIGSTKGPTLSERVLSVMGDVPDEDLGAMDLARMLRVTEESEINSIRSTLSRLAAEGKISKTGYARYRLGGAA